MKVYFFLLQRPDLWVSTDKVWFISPKHFCVNCFQFNFRKNSRLNSSWTLKFFELHTLFILSLWKKLTPMAVMYQVRYPSVSGTGAGWRNLELSPLPLSNDRYILNERRYHQPRELRHWAIVKRDKTTYISKTEPFKFDLWVKPEINIVPVQGKAFS